MDTRSAPNARQDAHKARRISRRRALQKAGALGAAAGAAWLVGVGERPAHGEPLPASASGGNCNVLYLHTGVLGEEVAESSGAWSWWDDYDRATLPAYSQHYQDATCIGGGYLFIAMNSPLGSLWRVKDADLSVKHLDLSASARGSGADMVYDAARGCVWVLWGDENSGANGISRIDVATWTESAYVAPLSPVATYGNRPSMALSRDGRYLLVAAYDNPQIQRIAIGPEPAYPLVHESVVQFPRTIDTSYFHILRVDPSDGHAYGGTVYSAFMVRLDTDMNVVWTYAGTPAVRDGATVPFGRSQQHDDMVFDTTYFYVPAGDGPPGVHQYRKSTGAYVTTISDPYDASGIEIDAATGDLYAPSFGLRGVIKLPPSRPFGKQYRQSDNQSGVVDDLAWNGSQLWTIHAPTAPSQHAYVDVIRWNKIEGPAGAGRIRCTPSPLTPHHIRSGVQGGTGAGVYAGGQFWFEALTFSSAHWTCITLSADTATANWFAKVAVRKATGIVTLLLGDGTVVDGAAAATGWNSFELRYDESSGRYRVYNGPGEPCIDYTSAAPATVGAVIYGPWDASQPETSRWGLHTAFDIGLDVLASEYAGARFGPVTAIRSVAPGQLTTREWAATGEANAAQTLMGDPDLLTGTSRDSAASYLSASGGADKWACPTSAYWATPIVTAVRHVRWGLRALHTTGGGRLKLGYGGDTARAKGDSWTLTDAVPLTPASAWYELRATKPRGGVMPSDRHNVAIVYVGGSGDARVTQAAISHLWQLDAADWGATGIGSAQPTGVAALPSPASRSRGHRAAYAIAGAGAAALAAVSAGAWRFRRKREPG